MGAGQAMGRNFVFENDIYRVEFSDNEQGTHFSLVFKEHPARAAQPAVAAGRGERISLPSTDHMKRKGVLEDEAIVLSKGEGLYEVESRSEPGAWHTVHVTENGEEVCTCVAHSYQRLCRHIRATRALEGRDVDAPLRAEITNDSNG